jgi:hypothetical protein
MWSFLLYPYREVELGAYKIYRTLSDLISVIEQEEPGFEPRSARG